MHKVPASSQRLIYMGKLLQDSQTLRESNISKSECVVHLFPKPNVVVMSPNVTDGSTCPTTHEPTSGNQANYAIPTEEEEVIAAHIPQIIIDHDAMQHSYTIFTSNELYEAQHRVKLLSFILLIISSMELLTLFTIFLAPPVPPDDSDDNIPPGDPTDYTNPTNSADIQYRTWRQTDYVDVFVSVAGVYVALLGLRASTENTLAGSKKYFFGLVAVGLSWLGYYFFLGVMDGKKMQQEQQEKQNDQDGGDANDDDSLMTPGGNIYTETLVGLTLPVAVWIICFLRAWQFRSLIAEAQREAEERQHLRQATISEVSNRNDLVQSAPANDLILTASIV